MNSIDEYTDVLSKRLPELLWTLSKRYTVIHPSLLPKGLFQCSFERTPAACIDEITNDVLLLKKNKNESCAGFLALRLQKKINVLVRLCRQQAGPASIQQSNAFSVQSISTRQQWLQSLKEEISTLSLQKEALSATFARLQGQQDPVFILNLQQEIGESERRLTVAKETLSKAITAN